MTTDSLHGALLDRLAASWITLGVPLGGPTDPTLIDPEALVVMTALHGPREPRLYEGAIDWCARSGTLVNGARLRTVAGEIDGDPGAIERFAALVAGAGGPRWPVLHGPPIAFETRGKTQTPDLRRAGALAVRLRALFGVAVRADLIAVLATMTGAAPSLAELAATARSSKRNVALAIDTLRLGGVVEVDLVGNQQRVRLTADPAFKAWLGNVPEATDWATRYLVIESVLKFEATSTIAGLARAVDARVLAERLHPLARRARLPTPKLGVKGEAFEGAYHGWVQELTAVVRP
jgi:hypothetical protein